MNKQIIIVVTALLTSIVIIVLLVVGWQRYTTTTINITAPQDAKIFIKQASNSFSEIGTTTATYKTRDAGVIIVEARDDGRVVQRSVTPAHNKTKTINLEFQPLVSAQIFSQGSLTNLFIQNGFTYGINSHTNNIAAFPILPSIGLSPILPSTLPFLKQVIWKNPKNFTAITLGRGSIVVKDNVIEDNENYPFSMVGVGQKNAVLLGKDGFYFSTDTDVSKTNRLSELIQNSIPQVFADSTYLYGVSLINEPIKDESDHPVGKETNLILYDQNGKQVNNFTVPIKSSIYKVVALNNSTLAILSENQLVLVDTNTKKITTQDFSFGFVKDMVIYKNKLLLLGSDGLWQYNTSTTEYYKIALYPPNQEYVPFSLTVLDGSLFFSTSVTSKALKEKTGPTVTNGVYKISL